MKQGAKDLAGKFDAVRERAEHDKLVRDKEVQRQIEWLKKHLRPLWTETLEPAIKRSYDRAYREKTT